MNNPNFLSKITGHAMRESDDLATSIQAHLTLLLNTRHGMTPNLPAFGLPDIHYVYYSLPHSLKHLGEEIRQTVLRYEPRLQKVKVNLVSADAGTFRATYRISGEVVEGSHVSRLTFETEVLRDGHANTQLVTQYG